LLSFIYVYFFDSILFNELRPIQIEKNRLALNSPVRLRAKHTVRPSLSNSSALFSIAEFLQAGLPKKESIQTDCGSAKDLLPATVTQQRKTQPRQWFGGEDAEDGFPVVGSDFRRLGEERSLTVRRQKIFSVAIRFHPLDRPWRVRNRGRHAMSDEPVILINLLKVKPEKQDALIALLKQNTDTVVRTIPGWKTTRLIAAKDGAGVVIYSEWETSAAVEAMRSDPRMKAYLPKLLELASLDSIVGSVVLV
jgi:quinol monooxygenase YgiN